MPTPFEHAWQRFGTSPARTHAASGAGPSKLCVPVRRRRDVSLDGVLTSRTPAGTGIFMASSNDFVKSNCCVLCDDRHHFRSLREKYEHLRSKKHLFNYLAYKKHCAHLMVERQQLDRVEAAAALRRHPFWPHADAAYLDAVLLDYIICFGRVRKDAVADAWRRHVRKEQSMLIALAAARTGSGHLVVELVMPFVAGRSLRDAPFYVY